MKKRCLSMIIFILLILLGGYNIYQWQKINNTKEYLTYVVQRNIQHFASREANIEDVDWYAEQLASIISAQDAYIAVCDRGVPEEEWEKNLACLLLEIKSTMYNDKQKFNSVFSRQDVCELMFRISDNFEDQDSIYKVYKILNEESENE